MDPSTRSILISTLEVVFGGLVCGVVSVAAVGTRRGKTAARHCRTGGTATLSRDACGVDLPGAKPRTARWRLDMNEESTVARDIQETVGELVGEVLALPATEANLGAKRRISRWRLEADGESASALARGIRHVVEGLDGEVLASPVTGTGTQVSAELSAYTRESDGASLADRLAAIPGVRRVRAL